MIPWLGTDPERDWPEDAQLENGQYMSHCAECSQAFLGHKRRAVCKACANAVPPKHQDPMYAADSTWRETIEEEVTYRRQHVSRMREGSEAMYTAVNQCAGFVLLVLGCAFAQQSLGVAVFLFAAAALVLVLMYFPVIWCIEAGQWADQAAIKLRVAIAWQHLELTNWLQVEAFRDQGLLLPWEVGKR